MAAKSKEQFKFMKAAQHNPDFAKKVGMDPKAAAEFTKENKGDKQYKKLPFSKTKKMMGK
jgi:hypothetical protein